MSLSRRASRNFLGQLAMLGISFADRILFTGLLIRAWGTDLFSDWATLLAGSGVLMTLEFGFQVLLGNSLVRAENKGRRRAFDRLIGLGICFYLSLAALLLLGIGLVLAFSSVDRLFHLVALHHATPIFLLLSGNVILRISRSALTQIFRGKGEVHQLMWTDVRSMGAILVLSAGAVLAGASPFFVAWIYFLGEILFGELVVLGMIRRRFSDVKLRPHVPTRREVGSVARALPWYGWLTGATHLMVHVPVLIVAWLSLAGAPLIALVVQRTLVNFGKSLSSAVSLAIGIEIADFSHASTAHEQEQAIRMLARFNVALAAMMAGGLLFFGAFIVRLWTGKADLGSPYILFWLLLPVVISGPAIPLQMVTFYRGRPQAQAVASGLQVILGLALALAAGRLFGVEGVAFGVGAGEAIGLGIVLPVLAARETGVRYLRMFAECMTFFVAALAWSALVGWAATRSLNLLTWRGLLIGVAGWSVLAAAPIALGSIPPKLRIKLAQRLFGPRTNSALR